MHIQVQMKQEHLVSPGPFDNLALFPPRFCIFHFDSISDIILPRHGTSAPFQRSRFGESASPSSCYNPSMASMIVHLLDSYMYNV